MKKLTSEQIIRTYIDYFVKHGHSEIESSSLIPHDDPTVLWINAGVTPLKKYFDGTVVPHNRRLTSCQKCIRTGDIESVGKTARHHTFFQMLGNFSVGDYFKEEALTMAYELLTGEDYFDFDVNKLYVTIYPKDIEAYNKWVELGVDPSHIIKLENNYWEIGEGPSGPDSEIFYDRGEEYDPEGLGIKLLEEEIENDRYIEIWNNVFSQYNAKEGISRDDYEELPSKNIDTGMGVERMACIIQGTKTNYETDLFMPIINKIEELSGIKYNSQMEFKVIADHIRTLTFALSDGATFENYGRGYVLRRLLRRAVRMGKKLNINTNFMSLLVEVVVDKYKAVYPELNENRELVKKLILEEENLFMKTLNSGEKKLDSIFNNSSNKIISGEDAFRLYDTYGFPIELTEEYASEKGFSIDIEGFKSYMEKQKELARSSRKVDQSMNLQNELLLNYKEESKFVGYDILSNETEIIAVLKDNEFIESTSDNCYIVLKENPFYAESGGQISDSGYLKNDSCKLKVLNVIKAPNGQHLIEVEVLSGTINKGDKIKTLVDQEKRTSVMKNHSAVHLLQKTLQEILGNNVHQAGSKVDIDSFRFDFTYHGKISDELIIEIEDSVNEKVNSNIDTNVEYMSLNDAREKGAMALFEDKYSDVVRVVTMGSSIELCAGTHVNNTKDINKIAILSIENKGANVYRIEGTTDKYIKDKIDEYSDYYVNEITKLLTKAKSILKESLENNIKIDFNFNIKHYEVESYKTIIFNKQQLDILKDQVKALEKDYKNKLNQQSVSNIDNYLEKKIIINNNEFIITTTNNLDNSLLKLLVDSILNKLNKGLVLLANLRDNNVNFIAKSNIEDDTINCGILIRELSQKCSGNGGGNKNFAQGGGTSSEEVESLLLDIINNIKEKM